MVVRTGNGVGNLFSRIPGPLLYRLAALWLILVLPACAATYRAHPDFYQNKDRIRTIAVISPRAEVFELDIDETKKIEDWSNAAEKNLSAAIVAELNARSGIVAKSLLQESLPDKTKTNLAETHGLFKAVTQSVFEHVYRLKQKFEDFDYSLGKEVQELGFADADAVVIIRATDHVKTTRLKVLQGALGVGAFVATSALAAAAGPAVGSAPHPTGFANVPVVHGSLAGSMAIIAAGPVTAGAVARAPVGAVSELGPHISMALVHARTGAILWYNRDVKNVGYDLVNPGNASEIVKQLLRDLPVGK